MATHPAVLQVVAEMVQQAGGVASIGDSPAGPVEIAQQVWAKTGMAEAASRVGAPLVLFKEAEWKRLNGYDYFIAKPLYEADLVINLPKIKTHGLTLYTGAVKNLFGAIPGTRKRELHLRAPGMPDFSRVLTDVLELVKTGLTIIDGVIGMEGEGPGTRGTPHAYRCLAASIDPLALDTVITQAMGYRLGEVLHLAEAGTRGPGGGRPRGDRDRRGSPGALLWAATIAHRQVVLARAFLDERAHLPRHAPAAPGVARACASVAGAVPRSAQRR